MRFQFVTKPLSEIRSDYIVIPVFEEDGAQIKLTILEDFLKETPKFGKLFEPQLLFQKDQKIYLLGAGKKAKFDYNSLQNWIGTATKQLAKKRQTSQLVFDPNIFDP